MSYRDADHARKALRHFGKRYPPSDPIDINVAVEELSILLGETLTMDAVKDYLESMHYVVTAEERVNDSYTPLEDIDPFCTAMVTNNELPNMTDADIDALLSKDMIVQNLDSSVPWRDNERYFQIYSQTHDADLRTTLVETNKRLVTSMAGRYLRYPGNTLEYDDLVSEGMMGLLTAIERFQPDRGTKFSTYAVFWIRQAIVRAIFDKGSLVRIPVHMGELIYKMLRCEEQVISLNGFIFAPEVAALLGVTVEKYYEVRQVYHMFYSLASMSAPIGNEGDTELGDLIVPLVGGYSSISETPDDPEIQFLGKERRILLDDLLSRLRTREREILSKRFGSEPQTLQDVGHTMGLTRERIRQIEKKSLKRLRTMLRKQSYADWHVERPNG